MHGTIRPPSSSTLTPRETEIALAVSAGRSNAEIAEELHLRVQTVKNGVSRILRKLQRANRVQLAMWAVTELRPATDPPGPGSEP
jgi:DNA-binding NarL/FixJ family response regulator